jgi:hypothetical protein
VSLTIDGTAPVALFPGQGSQTPDMRDLVGERARELRERCATLAQRILPDCSVETPAEDLAHA